jgi:hypothetical protein
MKYEGDEAETMNGKKAGSDDIQSFRKVKVTWTFG